ncbi:MAG: hypothetical protein J6Y03_05875 [Alphaproteobacteria bacterium]|nr:hypothetical protein [Alphaproteobacteria bacterium]
MYEFFSNDSPILHDVSFYSFSESLRESYFKGKKDIDSADGAYIRSNFNHLKNLILQYPESRRKKILTEKIMSYFLKNLATAEYYQVINEKKQDLKTLAFEVGANDLGIDLIKKEKVLKESAERSQRNYMARWGEKEEDDDEDDILEQKKEPEIKLLDDTPTFMLMMYGTRGISFAHQDPRTEKMDLAGQLINEFNIDPHKIVTVKLNRSSVFDRYGQTTPFMYFLERHDTWGDRESHPYLKVPPTTDHAFYANADLEFIDFANHRIYMSFLRAGLPIYAGKFATDHVVEALEKWNAEHPQPTQLIEDEAQTEKTPVFKLEQEIIQEEVPKDTQQKPRKVSHHKKVIDNETQNLFERENNKIR